MLLYVGVGNLLLLHCIFYQRIWCSMTLLYQSHPPLKLPKPLSAFERLNQSYQLATHNTTLCSIQCVSKPVQCFLGGRKRWQVLTAGFKNDRKRWIFVLPRSISPEPSRKIGWNTPRSTDYHCLQQNKTALVCTSLCVQWLYSSNQAIYFITGWSCNLKLGPFFHLERWPQSHVKALCIYANALQLYKCTHVG